MRSVTFYECEICDEQYLTEDDARKCEAQGLPEPMPFLPWDRPVPAFGESGVKYGQLKGVYIRCGFGQHEWWLDCTPYVYVSHNIESSLTPARAFDPRYGWDAFRYTKTPEDLRVWEETLASYGFQESDVDSWLMEVIRVVRKGNTK